MTTPVLNEIQVGSVDGSLLVGAVTMTPADDQLYLAWIYIDSATGAPAVSSVDGLGLTWSLVKAQCSGQDEHRLEVWSAIGEPSNTDPVIALLSGMPDGGYIAVERWGSVLVSDPVGASSGYNTNGANGACSGGVDTNDATGSITTTANGSVVAVGFVVDQIFSHTAGWTARVTNDDSPAGAVRASLEDVTVAGIGAATVGAANNLAGADDWALVAVEILGALRVTPTAASRTLARFFDPHTGRPLRDVARWQ